MIEIPPKVKLTPEIVSLLKNKDYKEYFDRAEKEYYYWDKVKYNSPKDVKPEYFWAALKFDRISNSISFGKYVFSFKINDNMLQYLHKFDTNFGRLISSEPMTARKVQEHYLLSSIMEEAIASSQMEGASTTRKVAKEMLRKKKKPKDSSQQMILNNYNTIRYLSENKDLPLSVDFLLEIHKKISEETLENSKFEGQFRDSDDIIVQNDITGEVAHCPPKVDEIEPVIADLCDFANNDYIFIHPIVKAIIIHFVISFLHPFTDGNGRTARSLFYWYMLKKRYQLTEFLSISRVIYATKAKYEKSFLYTEHDGYDLGYFINYNLIVIDRAYDELKAYIERKANEYASLSETVNISGVNERQLYILKKAIENPAAIIVSRDLETELGVSVKTIRSDLESLATLGLLQQKMLNKRLVGYSLASDFESKLREIKGN